ncbi:MAG: hypothetical protein PHF84_03965 [bacterium]|nr:hypothetical protein [bacterium]
MKIKGVNEPIQNDRYVHAAEEEDIRLTKEQEKRLQTRMEKADFKQNTSDTRLRNLMEEMKNAQALISENQVYLDNLVKAHEELKSTRDYRDIHAEFQKISESVKFNNKPLMEALIPKEIGFYQDKENLTKLEGDLNREIEKAKDRLSDSQHLLNRYSISVENIKASLNKNEVNQMKELFSENLLYKRFNSDIVISLIQ